MNSRKIIGQIGEDLAENYLRANSYEIIGRNFRIGHLEIDIIAKDQQKDEIVFFEVKTRVNNLKKEEDDDFKSGQIEKIKKAMVLYASPRKIDLEKMRLDYIYVALNKETGKASLKHYKDALN
jgi:putative endonuclease